MPEPPQASIRLDHFLKIEGVAATGGQAKIMIQSGEVTVNGQIETRRGCKLHAGDVVSIDDLSLTVEVE
jgi:ribosome-associated protein